MYRHLMQRLPPLACRISTASLPSNQPRGSAASIAAISSSSQTASGVAAGLAAGLADEVLAGVGAGGAGGGFGFVGVTVSSETAWATFGGGTLET